MIVKFEEGENPNKSIEFDIEHTNDKLYVTSEDSDGSYSMTIELTHKDARDLMYYLQNFFKSTSNG
jgi:hypothetical protein